ncbi:MAG: aminopeptidase P family protein [Oscillospiraceae bacterium]|nr:aminopeptidase P family protein [Oscillospiraceae bacterium]
MDRIEKLRKHLPEGFTAALVTSEVNRYYLLDFDSGDAGTLLVLPDAAYFIIDARYIEIAEKEVKNAEVVLQKKVLEQVAELLKKHGAARLLLESTTTLAEYGRLAAALSGVELVGDETLSGALDTCRRIKDETEWKNICTAQSITDAAFEYILPRLQPGCTESELAAEMEYFMRKNGAGKLAFSTILVAGAKTSLPHGVPGENRLQKGDFVTMDFGANYNGYCSDMTRTVAIGSVTDEMKQVYDTVLRAQLAACAFARAGQKGCEVDKVARDIINAAGYEGCFGHGLGHSVGIEIHESPRYSAAEQAVVEAGTVMTIEPGIYLPGRFGVRIEDTVLVKEDGIEIPGRTSKELIVL